MESHRRCEAVRDSLGLEHRRSLCLWISQKIFGSRLYLILAAVAMAEKAVSVNRVDSPARLVQIPKTYAPPLQQLPQGRQGGVAHSDIRGQMVAVVASL